MTRTSLIDRFAFFWKERKKSSKGRQQDDMSGMCKQIFFSQDISSKQKYSIYLLTSTFEFLDIHIFSRIIIQNKLYTLCLHYCHILFISNISQSWVHVTYVLYLVSNMSFWMQKMQHLQKNKVSLHSGLNSIVFGIFFNWGA